MKEITLFVEAISDSELELAQELIGKSGAKIPKSKSPVRGGPATLTVVGEIDAIGRVLALIHFQMLCGFACVGESN